MMAPGVAVHSMRPESCGTACHSTKPSQNTAFQLNLRNWLLHNSTTVCTYACRHFIAIKPSPATRLGTARPELITCPKLSCPTRALPTNSPVKLHLLSQLLPSVDHPPIQVVGCKCDAGAKHPAQEMGRFVGNSPQSAELSKRTGCSVVATVGGPGSCTVLPVRC